jgi:membrane fusion protein, heavy metal efflux system
MTKWPLLFTLALAGAGCASWIFYAYAGVEQRPISATETRRAADTLTTPQDVEHVTLLDDQLKGLKITHAKERIFRKEKEEIGTINFNEDLTVQIFPPYPGRILSVFAQTGQDVKKGEILFTLDSPDLLQAESALISAAGVARLTMQNLARFKELIKTHVVAQKDVEQAISDQQAAEGALNTARNALLVYGKTDHEIDQIIEQRLADSTLVVRSPVDGRITLRNASPGLFVQPGSGSAPYTVANIDTMWMIANVAETDSPTFQIGQRVRVKIDAFPDRDFDGKITMIDSMVDPNTRRVLMRSEVENPRRELRSGMFAKFVISTGQPMRSVAIPLDGVVREGDGSMTIWVAEGSNTFGRRAITTGVAQDGYWQILVGANPGERVVTEGALFLSNTSAALSD